VLAHAGRITGFPHHFSIHCGGIVISPEPLADYVPLTRSAKGFVITQMDMYGVEDLGLVKMDLLGNRSLAVLGDALALCEANGRGGPRHTGSGKHTVKGSASHPQANGDAGVFRREAVRMKSPGTRRGTSVALAGVMGLVAKPGGRQPDDDDNDAPPPDPRPLRERIHDLDSIAADPATRALIHSGDTMGCFYIESPGMRALFERLRCGNFEEVVAASSIIRPGVAESGMMQQYIIRHQTRRGAEPPPRPAPRGAAAAPAHPLMLRILPETYGVMVYQEDVLRVAHEVAGMTLGEADLLRRAMSGKMRSRDAMAAIRDKFLAGARARGLGEDDIAEIWRQISSFAGYSFCKGHSAAFAVLSYQVAYLKAHHPAEFFAAVLTNGGGFYGAGAYISAARRRGLRVLPPCVNTGALHYTGCTTDGDNGAAAGGWVRVGLAAIKGLSGATAQAIADARRRGGPFLSLADFIRRTGASADECRVLAKAGALDALHGPGIPADPARQRPALILQAELLQRSGAGAGLDLPGPEMLVTTLDRAVAPWSLRDLCRHEAQTLGFLISAHPLDLVEVPPGTVTADAIRQHARQRVRMAGWLIAAKILATKTRRQPMKMLTLEDHTGTFEACLFPRMYERLAPRTLTRGPYLLTGRVDMSLGSPTLNVTEVEVLA
jgi:DNA polymerase III alpha subunit